MLDLYFGTRVRAHNLRGRLVGILHEQTVAVALETIGNLERNQVRNNLQRVRLLREQVIVGGDVGAIGRRSGHEFHA